jgi:short-subunit dehydrogenase
MNQSATSILLTGASSGIGRALALAYARPGVTLALTGRDAARLDAVAAECVAAGATVISRPLDVTDAAAMAAWIAEVDATAPLSLVIANAGFINVLAADQPVEDTEMVHDLMTTNFGGVINTLHPAIERMLSRGRGHVVLMSSVAGVTRVPFAPAYAASKTAIRVYGDILHRRLRPHGIAVTVVMPGFVKSGLDSSYDAHKPMRLGTAKAASMIKRGLDRRKRRIGLPWLFYQSARLVSAMPLAIGDRLLGRNFARAVPRKKD